jgi:Na+/H+ antiporter NhaB|tara:strand:+ start:1316 stop:1570 length:255 start_codon:yes stop_codon:yes gene_type:complete
MNLVWLNVHNLQKIFMLITAHLFSKLLRRDLRDELQRLDQQKKIRTFVEITLSIVGIFAAAFIAASFGWIGLAVYLLFAAILFY